MFTCDMQFQFSISIVFRAKDHVVKSAAGHFALKRLINQDKGRLQSENKGKSVGMCVGD